MGLLHQDELDVSALAPRKLRGQAEGIREIAEDHGVRAADRRAEGRGGEPDHVGPGIHGGQHPMGGADLDTGNGIGAAGLGDARPDGARGPQFGDGEKIVGICAEAERDPRESVRYGNTGADQRSGVGDGRAGGERDFQSLTAAGLVGHLARGAEQLGLRIGLGHSRGDIGRGNQVGVDRAWTVARFREGAQWIEVEP